MKQIVIIKTFVAHLVCIEFLLTSVLSADLSVTDPLQIGRDNSGNVCVLSQFKATVVVKPSDSTFLGTTYRDITPETSFNKVTNCGNKLIEHYYRYSDTFEKTSVRQNSFSFGFDVNDDTIEVGLNYIEVLCDRPEGCLRSDPSYCNSKLSLDELKNRKCLRMYASYTLDRLKPGHSYQCSHNKWQKIKDFVYIDGISAIPHNTSGTVEIDLQYVRIDVTNSTETFNPLDYCLADWYLDPILLMIAGSIVCLLVFLCFCKCIIDCRRDRNRNRSGKYSMKRLEESTEESPDGHKRHDLQKEELGPTVQL